MVLTQLERWQSTVLASTAALKRSSAAPRPAPPRSSRPGRVAWVGRNLRPGRGTWTRAPEPLLFPGPPSRPATVPLAAPVALPPHSSSVLPSLTSSILPSLSSLLLPSPGLGAGVLANTIVYIFGRRVLLKGLALDGYVSSYVLGCLSYAAFGLYGYLIVCMYFLIGSYVTKLKMDVKVKEGTAEARGGRRGIGSVLGSGIAGMACAVAALVLVGTSSGVADASGGPLFDTLRVGFVASFCSKLSDTVSSEVGKAYGKTTYLATSFQRVPRGTEGAVSLEGTLAGVVASVVLGVCAVAGLMLDARGLTCVIGASVVANYAESLLGAGVQRGGHVRWLTNDAVNMFQISLASVVAMAWYLCINV